MSSCALVGKDRTAEGTGNHGVSQPGLSRSESWVPCPRTLCFSVVLAVSVVRVSEPTSVQRTLAMCSDLIQPTVQLYRKENKSCFVLSTNLHQNHLFFFFFLPLCNTVLLLKFIGICRKTIISVTTLTELCHFCAIIHYFL